jgi:NAD(P)H-dependent flavin oxidoreductase YrpB (nitropropane dioxygenase family)
LTPAHAVSDDLSVLRTPLCDLLGIDVPIIGAPFGPWEQVDLAAAICGALGSVGTALRGVPELRAQWERLRGLTDRPFAINHTVRPYDEEAFAATLARGCVSRCSPAAATSSSRSPASPPGSSTTCAPRRRSSGA